MQTIQLEEAQAHLAELIEGVAAGNEVVIAKGSRPVARLVPAGGTTARPQFGSAKGKIIFHAGWDEPCPDFEEYQ
jgi:prevent-host-death family protein